MQNAVGPALFNHSSLHASTEIPTCGVGSLAFWREYECHIVRQFCHIVTHMSWSGDQGVATVPQDVIWKRLYNCTEDQHMIGNDNDKRTDLYNGFTQKVDNKIVGRSTGPHSCTQWSHVFSQCLLSHKEGNPTQWELLLVKRQKDFFSSWKEKSPDTVFLFFQRKDPFPLSFLLYLISFLRKKVTYTGSILEVQSDSNAHTLLAPVGLTVICHTSSQT